MESTIWNICDDGYTQVNILFILFVLKVGKHDSSSRKLNLVIESPLCLQIRCQSFTEGTVTAGFDNQERSLKHLTLQHLNTIIVT